MKIGRAKLVNKPTITRGKKYNKYFVFISSYVVTDKAFPIKETDELLVRIVNGKLIIQKEE
ncbi:MAG: hypothetical protein FWG55_09355 [Candidatus Bathyarchaeota archaeon]|nr:hypothetical protein [Candidatus Termiticorpusculum sp.]